MADLGSWLTGAYRISRPLDEEDLDEGIPRGAVGEAGADQERLSGDGSQRDEEERASGAQEPGREPARKPTPSSRARRGARPGTN